MTPALAARCVRDGATVLVQRGAGLTAGFADAEYAAAGARMEADAATIWKSAELIVKVKEPLESEHDLLQEGQALFTYLHLAAVPELAEVLLKKNVLGIAYETVEAQDGSLPLLKPMSHIAGRLAIQVGAHFLQTQNGGAGVLLGGVPGVKPGSIAIIGAGNSGAHACRIAAGMGARVTVLDLDTRKLDYIDDMYRSAVTTLSATPANIESAVIGADLVVGAVLIPGGRAPVVVSEKMVRQMRPGSVIVDIAVDQGGCVETIHATSHQKPVYTEHGVIHYAVPNMPAMVGRTSTIALTQATEPFVARMIAKGVAGAIEESRGFAKGVNTRDGKIPNAAVAEALAR